MQARAAEAASGRGRGRETRENRSALSIELAIFGDIITSTYSSVYLSTHPKIIIITQYNLYLLLLEPIMPRTAGVVVVVLVLVWCGESPREKKWKVSTQISTLLMVAAGLVLLSEESFVSVTTYINIDAYQHNTVCAILLKEILRFIFQMIEGSIVGVVCQLRGKLSLSCCWLLHPSWSKC